MYKTTRETLVQSSHVIFNSFGPAKGDLWDHQGDGEPRKYTAGTASMSTNHIHLWMILFTVTRSLFFEWDHSSSQNISISP